MSFEIGNSESSIFVLPFKTVLPSLSPLKIHMTFRSGKGQSEHGMALSLLPRSSFFLDGEA